MSDLHQFLRFQAIAKQYPDLKLYASPEFIAFLKTRLSSRKSTTLAGRVVEDELYVNGVLVHVDKNSLRPFHLYY